jgi:hypothetical protein
LYGNTDNIEASPKYEATVILQAGQPQTNTQKNQANHHNPNCFFFGLEK